MRAGITVALTSIPPRFGGLGERLQELRDQAPERLVLTIPKTYARFPEWGGALPRVPAGVTLLRAADCGPATKFVEVMRRFPGEDVLICDDDCVYRPGWLDAFRAARAAQPATVIAASTFDTERLGLAAGGAIVQGFAGVLLNTSWITGAPDAQARWVDDIWLSAQLAAAGRAVAPCPQARACVQPLTVPGPLQDATIAGQTRAELNRAVAHRLAADLGIWCAPVASSG